MSLLVAHAGHWLTTIGFALAPLSVIAGVAAITLSERHRGRQSRLTPAPAPPRGE